MYLTLAMVVFFASIFVFFSQEFINIFKKIFALKGAKIIIPLALTSWIVCIFDDWFVWGVLYCRECMMLVLQEFIKFMPFTTGSTFVAMCLLLTLLSVGPVLLLNLYWKYRSYRTYPYPFTISTILLIVSALLLFAHK